MPRLVRQIDKVRAIGNRDGWNCHWCKMELTTEKNERTRKTNMATLDHKIPQADGGSNHIDNLLLSCKNCNHRRGCLTYEEYKAVVNLGTILDTSTNK